MAQAPANCPSYQGSGDGEMGKLRKVALITGITGQVSAGRGRAACSPWARGPPPRAGPPCHGELRSTSPGRCERLRDGTASAPAAWLSDCSGGVSWCCSPVHSVPPVPWVTVAFLPQNPSELLEGISYFADPDAGKKRVGEYVSMWSPKVRPAFLIPKA